MLRRVRPRGWAAGALVVSVSLVAPLVTPGVAAAGTGSDPAARVESGGNASRAAVLDGLKDLPCRPRSSPPEVGLELTGRDRESARLLRLTFRSAALNASTEVNVLLPPGYDAGTRRYPVLYLLHGHTGSEESWLRDGDAADIVGDRDMIVVMPDGGFDGWYSDWYGTDLDGHTPDPPPGWETYHLRELLPWVDDNLRTEPGREHRAVAGLSMGGFGAMSYAARNPELFGAAGSFSGGVHPTLLYPAAALVISGANLPQLRPLDLCIWGNPLTKYRNWAAHDPTVLAGELTGTDLYVATGTGTPSDPDDLNQGLLGAAGIEGAVLLMNLEFRRALDKAGADYEWDVHAGTHTWRYWPEDLRDFLTHLDAWQATER